VKCEFLADGKRRVRLDGEHFEHRKGKIRDKVAENFHSPEGCDRLATLRVFSKPESHVKFIKMNSL